MNRELGIGDIYIREIDREKPSIMDDLAQGYEQSLRRGAIIDVTLIRAGVCSALCNRSDCKPWQCTRARLGVW